MTDPARPASLSQLALLRSSRLGYTSTSRMSPRPSSRANTPRETDMFFWPASNKALLRAARKIINYLAPMLDSRLSVQLWDGSRVSLGTGEPGPFAVAISSPGVISSLLRRPTLANVTGHYLAGRIDIQGGDLMAFGEAAREKRLGRGLRGASKWYLFRQAWPFLLRRADRSTVRHAIPDSETGLTDRRDRYKHVQFHYDGIPTEAYQLFLDSEMVYSCAYFTAPDVSLEQAQKDKLEVICRKLQLERGERFLDIGCGWGGLLCYAAQRYGVRGHGITLSHEQFDYAREKVRRLGLEDRVTIELTDYANVTGTYDKIASIGMMEHVGIANYPAYFTKLGSLLRDRGLLLNQAIARGAKKTAARFKKLSPEYRLVQKYIFPGGELGHIGNTVEAMEGARFEIHDVEAWRHHYARTCRLWCQRLSARREEAVKLVGEEKYRAWVAYLAAFSFAFEDGLLRIFQTLASKHKARGLSGLPLTRKHLFEPAGRAA